MEFELTKARVCTMGRHTLGFPKRDIGSTVFQLQEVVDPYQNTYRIVSFLRIVFTRGSTRRVMS